MCALNETQRQAASCGTLLHVQDAEELLVRVAKGRDASIGPEAPDTLRALHSLGAGLIDAGRHVEAEGILR